MATAGTRRICAGRNRDAGLAVGVLRTRRGWCQRPEDLEAPSRLRRHLLSLERVQIGERRFSQSEEKIDSDPCFCSRSNCGATGSTARSSHGRRHPGAWPCSRTGPTWSACRTNEHARLSICENAMQKGANRTHARIPGWERPRSIAWPPDLLQAGAPSCDQTAYACAGRFIGFRDPRLFAAPGFFLRCDCPTDRGATRRYRWNDRTLCWPALASPFPHWRLPCSRESRKHGQTVLPVWPGMKRAWPAEQAIATPAMRPACVGARTRRRLAPHPPRLRKG